MAESAGDDYSAETATGSVGFFAVGDGVAWVVGLGVVTWVRYVFEETRFGVSGLLVVIFVAVVAQWFIGVVGHAYLGRFPLGSVDEVVNLARVMCIVGAVVLGVDLVPDIALVPRSVPLSAALVALVLAAGSRLVGGYLPVALLDLVAKEGVSRPRDEAGESGSATNPLLSVSGQS